MEKAAWKELATSTARKFVGPMPARDFLDSFLPRTPGMARVPTLKLPKTFGDDTHRNLERAKDVLVRRKLPFCSWDSDRRSLVSQFSAIRTCRICPNYKFLAAPPHKRHEDWYYHSQVAFLYPKYFRVRSCADSWQSAQMFVTFVVKHVDPFDSTERQWRDDDDTPYARGRQISYAKSQIYHQHRAFTFSLSILGRRARFVRWDVAGAVFSESFDYVSQPTWLAQFFWRYNHLSSTQRGLDPHVEPATLAQSRMLTQAMKVYLGKVKIGVLPLIPMVEDTLDKRHPTYKIHFDLTDKTPPFDLIVRRPFYNKPIIEDSGTRCYIGYHLGLRRLVFLKDFWPPHTPKQGIIEPDMYHFLASLKVTHLPDVLYADTPFWRSSNANPSFSLTQDLAGKFQGCNASKHLYARIHARIVQDIAYPLKSARYSRQLVQAIRDALIG
ncbi:hypothetical protein EW026_g4191 [Hermanssonia centrifuga]|uniref:Fungal-type protein kinase domain-containing protein n=1 Tax=Hermanssonia centrifuga TaxID=98765 RepID=A0A4S4KIT9_9APHY|nr:hypothetical protein EW026_g4191 [Hermanssonia centrifuga]